MPDCKFGWLRRSARCLTRSPMPTGLQPATWSACLCGAPTPNGSETRSPSHEDADLARWDAERRSAKSSPAVMGTPRAVAGSHARRDDVADNSDLPSNSNIRRHPEFARAMKVCGTSFAAHTQAYAEVIAAMWQHDRPLSKWIDELDQFEKAHATRESNDCVVRARGWSGIFHRPAKDLARQNAHVGVARDEERAHVDPNGRRAT